MKVVLWIALDLFLFLAPLEKCDKQPVDAYHAWGSFQNNPFLVHPGLWNKGPSMIAL